MVRKTSIKLVETENQFRKKVNKAIADEANKNIPKKIPKVRNQIRPLVSTALLASPEILSLQSGILRAEFGLERDPSADIVEAIVKSLKVQYFPISSKNLTGGIRVIMQPASFSNLLSLDVAQQPIEGGSLPWLEWLLTLGDSIIIANFGVQFGAFQDTRSGQARMNSKFAPYKVNSAFSGTRDNNFITRAVERIEPDITRIIKGAF
jgi:hypothetical protein